jgi:hypothetical protein
MWRVRSQEFRIFVFDTPVGHADITFQLSCNCAALLWPFILLFRQSVKSAKKKRICARISQRSNITSPLFCGMLFKRLLYCFAAAAHTF